MNKSRTNSENLAETQNSLEARSEQMKDGQTLKRKHIMNKSLNYLLVLSMVLIAVPAQTAEELNQKKYQPTKNIYSLIGMKVKTTQDQKLGTVKDLALDMENARLVEVIVSSGGFLGFNQRTVAVPPEAITHDEKADVLRLSNVSEEEYKAAPDFIMSKWAEHCTSLRITEAYRYYGVTPYFAADGQRSPSGNTATEPLGYIERSSKLTGLPIKNLNKETLGFVGGFIYDPLGGQVRIKHVIVRITGFLKTKRINWVCS
jgi:sporulation protein YlmC with PRC-barrel domain